MKIGDKEINASGFVLPEDQKNTNFGRVDPDQRQIEFCKNWLSYNYEKAKTYPPYANSVSLKQKAEESYDQRFISNGAMIVAALVLGFEVKQDRQNGCFKMKIKK